MDSIDVELTKYTDTSYNIDHEDIVLVLNGEKVEGVFDSMGFVATPFRPKNYTDEVLTCGCGHAGCAGIWDGTKIKRRRHTVEWRDIDSGLPKRFYSFDKTQYDAAVAKTLALLRGIAERREGTDRDHYYGVTSFGSVEELQERLDWMKYWYTERA